MAGAVETMAVTPQMLVPAATSVPRRGGRPSHRLNHVTNTMPVAMAASTTGSPAMPSFSTSNTLRRMPTSTMPRRRMVVVENFKPGESDAGSGSRFRSSSPSTMATGTPEIGLLPVSPCADRIAWPIRSASQKPASITTNAARTPGTSTTASHGHPRTC